MSSSPSQGSRLFPSPATLPPGFLPAPRAPPSRWGRVVGGGARERLRGEDHSHPACARFWAIAWTCPGPLLPSVCLVKAGYIDPRGGIPKRAGSTLTGCLPSLHVVSTVWTARRKTAHLGSPLCSHSGYGTHPHRFLLSDGLHFFKNLSCLVLPIFTTFL